jgi:hypothetical protein
MLPRRPCIHCIGGGVAFGLGVIPHALTYVGVSESASVFCGNACDRVGRGWVGTLGNNQHPLGAVGAYVQVTDGRGKTLT